MRSLIRNSVFYRAYLIFHRARFALSYYREPIWQLIRWLGKSRETSNFTYDLLPLNLSQLTGFLSVVSDISHADAEKYLNEILHDRELQQHVSSLTLSSPDCHERDPLAKFGRRIGWYALVRARKPKVVVESGIDKGLGSCVLAAAILRNREEGHDGTYIGIDIDPKAGYLFRPPYSEAGRIAYGDSIETIQGLDLKVDLYLNDSDHSDEYEAREYKTIEPKLSHSALLLADNAHCNDKLFQHAKQTGRNFLFFREQPLSHWYPGAGIGVAWGKSRA